MVVPCQLGDIKIVSLVSFFCDDDNNNNNNNNNNNGNFICVFECTIVNLAMYRQFTNTA